MDVPRHRVLGHGPPFVLVHGTAPDLFDALETALLPHGRVVRLDRRGFPGSDLPIVHTLPPHAEDLAAIVHGLGEPAVLVGWSVGAVIALEVALRWPDKLRGLVLLEPPWRAKQHPTLAMLGGILGGKVLGALGRPEAGGERFLRWALSRRGGGDELATLADTDRARVRAAGRAILAELDGGTGEHLDPGPLPMPVALVHGDSSTPEFSAAAQRLGASLGVTPMVLGGAGHLLQHTHAEHVARIAVELGRRGGAA